MYQKKHGRGTNTTKNSRYSRLKRWCKYHYLRVMRTNGTPYSLAMGLAIGVFVGFLPVIPFQTLATIILCLPLRGNPLVAALGTWISNPLNWVPFYYGLYKAGHYMAPWPVPNMDMDKFASLLESVDLRKLASLGEELLEVLGTMIFAGAIIGFPVAVLTFFVSRKLIIRFRNRRIARMLEARLKKQV